MVGVDLFAGVGGMSLGAKQAGVEVRLAVERDRWAAATYSANHVDTKVIVDDVRAVRRIPVRSNGEKRVLFGGPPCKGFSTSNQRTRGRDECHCRASLALYVQTSIRNMKRILSISIVH